MINRYSFPEMQEIWSNENKLHLWFKIELLNLEALCKIGKIHSDTLEEFKKIKIPTAKEVEDEELKTNHDVVAFTNLLFAKTKNKEILRFLHFGMTSSDLLDTTHFYRILKSCDLILKSLKLLFETLKQTAIKHRKTRQIGRTHGMHAESTVFGLKIMNFAFAIHRSYTQLKEMVKNLSVVKFSGTVGNYCNTYPEIEKYIADKLNVNYSPVSTQVIMRDQSTHILNTISVATTICEAIALEIRNLQRSEVAEVQEFFKEGQKGSSAMPHKQNPILAERICGLSKTIRGYLIPSMENIVLWHERDISHSSSERIILPDFMTISHYILNKTQKLIEELVVNEDRMLENCNRSSKIYSATLLRELILIGFERQIAYNAIQAESNSLKKNENLLEKIEKRFNIKIDTNAIADKEEDNLKKIFKRLNELSID